MTHCNYDLDKDLRRKGALRQEIQRLKDMSDNYQFVIDSLCLAEEPLLSQLMQLIRSNQSIEVIANTWRSSNFHILGQLQAASLLEFDGINEGNNIGDSAGGLPFMEMATNQPGMNISQSNAQTNQPSINISQSNVQINQPSVQMSQMPQMPVVLGMPGMPDQVGLLLSQNVNAPAVTGVEDKQEAPLNLNGWYDEWGRLWPAF
jgi:hypothetical protein